MTHALSPEHQDAIELIIDVWSRFAQTNDLFRGMPHPNPIICHSNVNIPFSELSHADVRDKFEQQLRQKALQKLPSGIQHWDIQETPIKIPEGCRSYTPSTVMYQVIFYPIIEPPRVRTFGDIIGELAGAVAPLVAVGALACFAYNVVKSNPRSR